MTGLYVHVPFCVRKCRYCDFYSLPSRSNRMQDYVKAVLQEAAAYPTLSLRGAVSDEAIPVTTAVASKGLPRPDCIGARNDSKESPAPSGVWSLDTLYLGGGTPSLLGPKNLADLIGGLRQTFDFSGLEEATIEANPDSATSEVFEAALAAGFNRVSIGVQSLSDCELKSVGRVHTAAQAVKAVSLALRLGFKSVSADLIAGLPGQDWESLQQSLRTLVGLGLQHVSLYCLSLEEGTPLFENPPTDLPTDDDQADLFERARTWLAGGGFVHYEISNFALEGHQCRHNLNYWRGGEYLGLGPAAASHLDGKRFKNRADLDAYLADPTGQVEEVEQLDAAAKAAEEAMLRLRLLDEGLDTSELAARFGPSGAAPVLSRLSRLATEGLLVTSASEGSPNYRLPPSRILTCNPILAEVI